MSWRLSDAEFQAVRRLPSAERVTYLVKRVADQGAIWSLRNADGWVLANDDAGRELQPIWPHARYAEASAVGPWVDTEPGRIAVRDWLSTWTPGLTRDGRFVALFPTDAGDEVAVDPEVLAEAIREELARFG